MPDYSQMTEIELRLQLDKLNLKLAEKEPLLMAEISMVRSFIEHAQKAEKSEDRQKILYNDVRFPKDALERAFTLNGDFVLTHEELVSQICDGGYLHTGKSSSRAIINSTVNNALKDKKLTVKHGKIGRAPGVHLK